jgi:uncharacterized protein
MVNTLSTPVSRIVILDVLRGFTLFGIIIIHMVEQYYAGMIPQAIQENSPSSLIDNIVQGFAFIFIMGKFFMIFSFLFGLSFHIQFAKAENNKTFFLRFAWRLAILFMIGMIHHIHYRGDILTIFAILGLGLLLCYRLPDKVLLILALALVINIPSAVMRVAQGLSSESTMMAEQNESELMHYYNTVKSGTYFQILKLNFLAFRDKMEFQVISGRIFITFGLFLLGLYVGRKKYFERIGENIAAIKKLLLLSWKVLAGAIVFGAIFFGGAELLKLKLPDFVSWAIGGLLYDLANSCLSLFYITGIILLFQKDRWKKRLMNFYEVGRMGLTTYVMQSIFGVLIFFSYGLGLLSELGAGVCLIIAVVLFVFQIVLSKFWFRHFNYGLLEWIWRALTYFKVPPLRKKPESSLITDRVPTLH